MDMRHRLLIKIVIVVILLFLQTDRRHCDALLLKCPIYQMHLQKILGFRPPLDYLSERNLMFVPENNYKYRFKRDGYTVTQDHSDIDRYDEPIVSTICWRICNEDDDCIAYVHLLDTNECYGFSYFERSSCYRVINAELPLVADPEAIYYEKTCLKVPDMCKSRLWTLTKIPGSSLVFQGKKTIATLVTRRSCAEKCLFEREFKCLSASFAPSYRNNRERFGELMAQPQNKHETLGRCILSDKDKMIQTDAFRAAPYDEEYIENQCYERPAENDNCSYELYSNSSFIYAEAKYTGLTQKECQSQCTHESKFYCQGVSFTAPQDDLSRSQCLLHSEDIISMGPRSLKLKVNSIYMRRVKCLDVQVICSHDEMAIKYTPNDWFRGRMYVSSHSEDCVTLGNGTKSTLLRLPIGSEAKESRCGVLRAYEVTKQYQRIFISALIVIQNNVNVQTQGDRLIKVGCIISNNTLTVNHDDTDDDFNREEDVPNAIALESSLEFAQQTLPNEGTILFNTSDAQLMPRIKLQIVDLSHQHETNDVRIGQNLELQIIAEPPHQLEFTALSLYDIRATSLIAKSPDNQNYILLIDERGCPIDVTVFPALERVRTVTRNMLRARFHAFKFAGTSLVSFDVKIHFCTNRCPEVNCLQYGAGASAAKEKIWMRKRRNAPIHQQQQQDQYIQVKSPVYISTVMDVMNTTATSAVSASESTFNSSLIESDVKQDFEVPLNFNLRVRGPDKPDSNSFIYGERGVLLIAGIDGQLHSDGVYINQSLLIALLIFWLCFQVALLFGCCYIIQKYKRLATLEEERRKIHESLEYLESRRVHWADQGGYTL